MPAVPRLDMARNWPRPVSIEPRAERGNSRTLHRDIRPANAVAIMPGDAAGLASVACAGRVGDGRSLAASIAGFSIHASRRGLPFRQQERGHNRRDQQSNPSMPARRCGFVQCRWSVLRKASAAGCPAACTTAALTRQVSQYILQWY